MSGLEHGKTVVFDLPLFGFHGQVVVMLYLYLFPEDPYVVFILPVFLFSDDVVRICWARWQSAVNS